MRFLGCCHQLVENGPRLRFLVLFQQVAHGLRLDIHVAHDLAQIIMQFAPDAFTFFEGGHALALLFNLFAFAEIMQGNDHRRSPLIGRRAQTGFEWKLFAHCGVGFHFIDRCRRFGQCGSGKRWRLVGHERGKPGRQQSGHGFAHQFMVWIAKECRRCGVGIDNLPTIVNQDRLKGGGCQFTEARFTFGQRLGALRDLHFQQAILRFNGMDAPLVATVGQRQ